MKDIPPLTSVRAFIEVAELGAFNEASVKLGLSSSATSKAVTRLEEHLGVKLLHRTTRSIALTPEGERYLEGAKKIIAEFGILGEEISDTTVAPSGRLKVSAPTAFGRLWLVKALAEFADTWPKVTVELTLDDKTADLAGDAVDVAIRAGSLSDSAHLIARKLFETPSMICASPEYWQQYGMPTHPDELKMHRCLKFRNARTGRLYPWYFREMGDTHHQLFESAVEINDGEAIVNAAIAGVGVSQMPGYLAKNGVAKGLLVEALSEYRPENVAFHAVYLDRRLLSPRIRVFIDFLVKWTKRDSVG